MPTSVVYYLLLLFTFNIINIDLKIATQTVNLKLYDALPLLALLYLLRGSYMYFTTYQTVSKHMDLIPWNIYNLLAALKTLWVYKGVQIQTVHLFD